MSPGVVRRAARRSEMKVMFAVRVRLVRSSLGPASTCIEDPRVRTSSVASRSARSERSYRVRHRRLESWTSSQERRGLCQAPDTTSASRAQKVEDGTSSLFARKHTARKLEGLPFRAAIGDRQAVYWWLLGHELSFQAKSLGSRPRASNRSRQRHRPPFATCGCIPALPRRTASKSTGTLRLAPCSCRPSARRVPA